MARIKGFKRFVVDIDIICDKCGKSCICENGNIESAEFGEVSARFGYWSEQDGKIHQYELCESCFMNVVKLINKK